MATWAEMAALQAWQGVYGPITSNATDLEAEACKAGDWVIELAERAKESRLAKAEREGISR